MLALYILIIEISSIRQRSGNIIVNRCREVNKNNLLGIQFLIKIEVCKLLHLNLSASIQIQIMYVRFVVRIMLTSLMS